MAIIVMVIVTMATAVMRREYHKVTETASQVIAPYLPAGRPSYQTSWKASAGQLEVTGRGTKVKVKVSKVTIRR